MGYGRRKGGWNPLQNDSSQAKAALDCVERCFDRAQGANASSSQGLFGVEYVLVPVPASHRARSNLITRTDD